MSADPIVIVGGGHAAAALCAALAEAGQGGRVHLVSAEHELPYQRPPLSKSFLKKADETIAPHKATAWYAEQGMQTHLGDPVVYIDREARRVLLRSGTRLAYQHLVLATGTRARTLDALPPGLLNVHVLRDADHARSLRIRLSEMVASGRRLTVLGGGFIGLELAASARQLGLDVTVLEVAPRLLGRSVSASLGEYVLAHHRSMGTEVQIGVRIEGFELQEGRLLSMQVNGNRVAVDELVLGIGGVPEARLAADCGLVVENGIVVDACMRTSDPAILAIGDCAAFPIAGGARIRLESVQNANDQARTAAATLLGREEPYAPADGGTVTNFPADHTTRRGERQQLHSVSRCRRQTAVCRVGQRTAGPHDVAQVDRGRFADESGFSGRSFDPFEVAARLNLLPRQLRSVARNPLAIHISGA